MNQILYTGGKKGKSGMANSKKTVIVFIVFIIIFAICLIGIGANLLIKVKNKNSNNNVGNTTQNPVDEQEKSNIEIEFESLLGEVKVKIKSDINLQNITYWWDEDEVTKIETNEKEYEVIIPSKQGTHKLNVEVIDENGGIEKASPTIIGDSEPKVTILTDGVSNYVITASDDEKITKLVIDLNGEIEEIEVDAKEIEYKVPIPQGDSLIQVTVYNLNGISVTKKAKITNFGG